MINDINERMVMFEGSKQGALPRSQVSKLIRPRSSSNRIGRIFTRPGNCSSDDMFHCADDIDWKGA